MKCPKCQFDNREGVKFCEKCGTSMELVCAKCGANGTRGRCFFVDKLHAKRLVEFL